CQGRRWGETRATRRGVVASPRLSLYRENMPTNLAPLVPWQPPEGLEDWSAETTACPGHQELIAPSARPETKTFRKRRERTARPSVTQPSPGRGSKLKNSVRAAMTRRRRLARMTARP